LLNSLVLEANLATFAGVFTSKPILLGNAMKNQTHLFHLNKTLLKKIYILLLAKTNQLLLGYNTHMQAFA